MFSFSGTEYAKHAVSSTQHTIESHYAVTLPPLDNVQALLLLLLHDYGAASAARRRRGDGVVAVDGRGRAVGRRVEHLAVGSPVSAAGSRGRRGGGEAA